MINDCNKWLSITVSRLKIQKNNSFFFVSQCIHTLIMKFTNPSLLQRMFQQADKSLHEQKAHIFQYGRLMFVQA